MAIAVASAAITATSVASASNSYACNKPTGAAVGDVLIAFYLGTSTSSPTALGASQAGFTKILSRIDTNGLGDYFQAAAYYRVVDGTEGSTFTFTQTATGPTGGSLSVIRLIGVNTNSPIDTSASAFDVTANTAPTAPSVSPAGVADMLMIWACSYSAGSETTGWANVASSGFSLIANTTLNDTSNLIYLGAQQKTLSASGATGTTTISFPGTSQYSFQAITLAISPAPYRFRRDLSYYLEQ